MRQHDARHFQCVDVSKLALNIQFFARCLEERQVKPCVVCDQHAVTHKRKELVQRFGQVGCIGNRLVRNAGQLGDLGRNGFVRVDVSLERVLDLALSHQYRCNLGDLLGCGL